MHNLSVVVLSLFYKAVKYNVLVQGLRLSPDPEFAEEGQFLFKGHIPPEG
jgi:hypothetical protein